MWLLREILRYLLAILAGIVYAIILGAIIGAAGAVIFNPMIGMVGLGGGAAYGLGYGFQYVLENFLPTVPEHDNAPMRTDIHPPEINETSEKIKRLHTAKKIKLLSQKEISLYQETQLENKDNLGNVVSIEQLENYKNYIEDFCAISQKSFRELDEPVTIEVLEKNTPQIKPWVHTYEKEDLQKWVDAKGPRATEPFVGCDLSDTKYKVSIYAGFPEWVCSFITLVRSMLHPSTPASPKPTNTTSRVLTANHRKAFYAGYSTIFSTPINNPVPTEERQHETTRNIIPSY